MPKTSLRGDVEAWHDILTRRIWGRLGARWDAAGCGVEETVPASGVEPKAPLHIDVISRSMVTLAVSIYTAHTSGCF
jgi:hypothetical protein